MSQQIFSPFNTFDEIQRRLGRGIYPPRREASPARDNASWLPDVDIEEDDTRFVVLADVPGVAIGDLDITLTDNLLTIEGSREPAAPGEARRSSRKERATGKFSRQFYLPKSVDADAITARMDNGVLQIVIPKVETRQPRTIEIQ